MPQRLLLEGSDIDELLERVRIEHGPDARIVHAEQKLVGGVGGFFAKRRFEVAVALDHPPSGPASIDDLLALADAQDGAAPQAVPAAPAARAGAAEPAPEPACPTSVSTPVSTPVSHAGIHAACATRVVRCRPRASPSTTSSAS